jgi:hypothetical protein
MSTIGKCISARPLPRTPLCPECIGWPSLLKRWLLRTHHGSIQPEHLDAYLDEFVFRFNRRASGSRGLLFYRVLQQAVLTAPVTYEDVVQKTGRRGTIEAV